MPKLSEAQRNDFQQAAIEELGFSLPSPLRDKNVLLVHIPWTFETKSGLEINHSETLPPIWGVVILTGKRVQHVGYGDHVRFRRHSGEEISWRGEKYWMHHIDDIECVIEDTDEFLSTPGVPGENANVVPA